MGHRSGGNEKCHARGKARARAYLCNFFERRDFYDAEDNLIFQWKPRAKLMTTARNVMVDWDAFSSRSWHSTGWKEHKHKRQWEHRARLEEKRRKNRNR